MARPSEKRIALRNNVVGRAIEMEDGKGRRGGFRGDQGCDGGGGRDSLVEEGNAKGGAAERIQHREGRLSLELLATKN